MRKAIPSDTQLIWNLLEETIQWLRSRGSDQWSTWRTWGGPSGKVTRAISDGYVWLLFDGSVLVATITVEERGDPDFWTVDELAEPALYVSKLAVSRMYAGQSIGYLLLEWVRDRAYRRKANWIRLDAWRTNKELHAYYFRHGWEFVRDVDNPHRESGTLFQCRPMPMPTDLANQINETPRSAAGTQP